MTGTASTPASSVMPGQPAAKPLRDRHRAVCARCRAQLRAICGLIEAIGLSADLDVAHTRSCVPPPKRPCGCADFGRELARLGSSGKITTLLKLRRGSRRADHFSAIPFGHAPPGGPSSLCRGLQPLLPYINAGSASGKRLEEAGFVPRFMPAGLTTIGSAPRDPPIAANIALIIETPAVPVVVDAASPPSEAGPGHGDEASPMHLALDQQRHRPGR